MSSLIQTVFPETLNSPQRRRLQSFHSEWQPSSIHLVVIANFHFHCQSMKTTRRDTKTRKYQITYSVIQYWSIFIRGRGRSKQKVFPMKKFPFRRKGAGQKIVYNFGTNDKLYEASGESWKRGRQSEIKIIESNILQFLIGVCWINTSF